MASVKSTPSRATDNQAPPFKVIPHAFLESRDGWTEIIVDNAPLTISLEEELVNDENLESFI